MLRWFRKENVNLNQGAESTVCYLSARILAETYFSKKKPVVSRVKVFTHRKEIASLIQTR
jgi:hypothetical protein